MTKRVPGGANLENGSDPTRQGIKADMTNAQT